MMLNQPSNGTSGIMPNGHHNGTKVHTTSSHNTSTITATNGRAGLSSTTTTTATVTEPTSTSSMTVTGTPHGNRHYLKQQHQQQPLSYETFAPRSQQQRNRLAKLQFINAGPIPSTSTVTANDMTSNNSGSSSSNGMLHQAMVPSNTSNQENQFDSKVLLSSFVSSSSSSSSSSSAQEQTAETATTTAAIEAALQTAHQTSSHITQILTQTSKLKSALQQSTTLTTQITNRHSSLLKHSSELSFAAERLQNEYDTLLNHAKEIGLPLEHYDAVDMLSTTVGILFKNGVVVKGIARVKVDDLEEFHNVLDRVDDAIAFFAKRVDEIHNKQQQQQQQQQQQSLQHGSGSGSIEYYKRALSLHEAALDLLREAIVTRINTTTIQITNALNLGKSYVKGDVLESSLIYTRFHGISSRSHSLIQLIDKRIGSIYVPNYSRRRRIGERSRNHNSGTGSGGEVSSLSQNSSQNDNNMDPYLDLWTLCRDSYIQSRTTLLKLSIRNHLDFLKEKHGLIGMTRLASVFLMRLCTIETRLYLDFFGKDLDLDNNNDGNDDDDDNENDNKKEADEDDKNNSNGDKKDDDDDDMHATKKKVSFQSDAAKVTSTINATTVTTTTSTASTNKKKDAATLASQVMTKNGIYYDTSFQAFLDALCDNLYRTIRRGIVTILDLDTLCQIVSVLREEQSLANASPTTMAAARSIGRVIVDAQERLIFCANSVLGKDVFRFKSTPMDLDYPDKLRRFKEGHSLDLNGNGTSSKENGDGGGEGAGGSSEVAFKMQMQVYESWFPPIRSVLKVLSKIFRVVEPHVFEDIALTSVQACSRSLKEGSLHIERKSGVLHSDLFLVKHLLILREQLSPFDIQLRSVERQLDFSDAGKAVSRFIANRNRRLFSMTSENALVTLLCEGVSTREASIDSKRDLEDALRSACNDFIEHTSSSLAGPILTFVEQCKSVKVTNNGSLKEQSFMTGDYVMAVMSRAMDRLEPELGEINTQMSLYMDNAATRSILLKPVVRKITRLLEEARAFINEGAVMDDEENESNWTEEKKDAVLKIMSDFEKMIKSASPRV